MSEKVREFVEHFSYLFSSSVHAPVRINLINTGDCREVVQGLVQFYVRELNNSKRVMPIQVTMYSDQKMDNAFEIMSKEDNADEKAIEELQIEIQEKKQYLEERKNLYRIR